MSQRERNDAIFQAALTPASSPSLTLGMTDRIHDALVATPQAKARPGWSIGGRSFLPVARLAWAILLVVALLVLVVPAMLGAYAGFAVARVVNRAG